LEELSIFFSRLVNFDDLCSCKQLHDHSGGDNWGNTQLHESSLIGS
jgi:hypothetical protein